MRRLMSFDTSTTGIPGLSSFSCRIEPRIRLSGITLPKRRAGLDRLQLEVQLAHALGIAQLQALGLHQRDAALDGTLAVGLDDLVEEAADLARVAGCFRVALLAVVQLLQDHHRYEDVVFLELEQRGRIVHQHVGVQHVDPLASRHRISRGTAGEGRSRDQNFIGSMIASRLRWSQNSMKSSRRAAMCMLAGMPIVTWEVNISAPVCMAR